MVTSNSHKKGEQWTASQLGYLPLINQSLWTLRKIPETRPNAFTYLRSGLKKHLNSTETSRRWSEAEKIFFFPFASFIIFHDFLLRFSCVFSIAKLEIFLCVDVCAHRMNSAEFLFKNDHRKYYWSSSLFSAAWKSWGTDFLVHFESRLSLS